MSLLIFIVIKWVVEFLRDYALAQLANMERILLAKRLCHIAMFGHIRGFITYCFLHAG
ncbi:MAG: hypothetical protein KIT26_12135 [Nitrosomonas sp.]|nr:hypothetical protein [Nitrosomonas sp.]